MKIQKIISSNAFVLLLLTAPLLATPLVAVAEQAYITDKFIIKVYSLQNETGLVVDNLTSGTPVEILSTDGNYARIKTQDGKTGWLNTKYLNKQVPASQAYAELLTKFNAATVELGKAKVDLHKLKEVERVARNAGAAQDELIQRQKQIDALERDLKARDRQLATAQQRITDLKQELASNQATSDSDSPASTVESNNNSDNTQTASEAPPLEIEQDHYVVPFLWAFIAMVFTAIVGFMLGIKWLDRSIRKRHGGVRLY